MKQKIVKVIGFVCGTCLTLFMAVIGGGRSFLFFGELPIPEEK